MAKNIRITLLSVLCFLFSSDGLSREHKKRMTTQEDVQALCDKAGILTVRDTGEIGSNKKYIQTGRFPLGLLSHNSTYYRQLECHKRIPPGSVLQYVEKMDYRNLDNPLSKRPSWSGLWYKVIADDGEIGWVLGESVEDKRKYAVEVNIHTIDNTRRPKKTDVKYSAEEIRNWYFFDEAGGNQFLRIYLSDAMKVFRATNTAEILGRVNSVSQDDPPEQVLADVEKALKDFVKVVDLIALLGGEFATNNDEYGELYTLFLINRARTKFQPASFSYENLEKDGFKKASATASAFHASGLNPSVVEKWTHGDGREYVYTTDSLAYGQLIFDGINNGTYNYCSDFVCHMIMDVMPWVLWGATINDTTTPNERAIAFRDAFTALRYIDNAKGRVNKWTSFDF